MQNEFLLGMWYVNVNIYICVRHVLRATKCHKQLTFEIILTTLKNGDDSGMVFYWLDQLIYIINQ